MYIFTMDATYGKNAEIDLFNSAIWTERYGGDGEFELHVPFKKELLSTLSNGSLLGESDSDEPMIIESQNIEGGEIVCKGITLTKWLNNRFIRSDPYAASKEWGVNDTPPGQVMTTIVQNWAIDSEFLTDRSPGDYPANHSMGIQNASIFKIPDLYIKSSDMSGPNMTGAVPFGAMFDALKLIADTYDLGQKITREKSVTTGLYSLGYQSYKGKDRTSDQSVNDLVRFTPSMDSLVNIKELQAIDQSKNLLFLFAPDVDSAWNVNRPGVSNPAPTERGFDLRAEMLWSSVSQNTIDDIPWTDTNPENIYNNLMAQELATYLPDRQPTKMIDGEVSNSGSFKFGRDYGMGDLIEMEGNSGTIYKARVTEYIRSHDQSGEKAYPTVVLID